MLSNSIEFNIVAFWPCIAITTQYPKLSRLALGMLSVPASSATSEQTFSTCENVLDKERCSIGANSIDAILVLNSARNTAD